MSEVLVEVDDGIAVITLNRPQARNAIDGALSRGLVAALARVRNEDSIRVGVITGAGGNFCAGMDLKAFLAGEKIAAEGMPTGAQAIPIEKPMIGAVEGYAVAGGFELLLACDIVVAAESARFGLSEVKRGLMASGGGLLWLPRQAPAKIVNEMVLTGDQMDAETLFRHGMINRVTPTGQALDGALTYARSIAANGPLAVRASKQILSQAAAWPIDEMFDRQAAISAPVFASADAREGSAAFMGKRPPIWTGA
jgi:enoyl-CoA hydratase